MRGRACAKGMAIIEEIGRHGQSSSRKRDKPSGTKSVISIHIPLVPEHSRRKGGNLSGRQGCNAGVPPEAHSAVCLGYRNGVPSHRVHPEDRAGQRILRAAPVGWWTEAWVAPSACPSRGIGGIDHTVCGCFLVADQRAVWRV